VRECSRVDGRVRLVGDGENHGRGTARAIGVAHARGRLVAMVDGDIRVPAHWYSTCAAELAHLDGVGGRAVPDGDVAFVHRALRLPAKPRDGTTAITGNNGMFRRTVFDRVTYDPSLRNGEDVEFNERAVDAGLAFATLPDLTVEHCETKSYIDSLSWLFESGAGAAQQLQRTRRWRTPDIVFVGWLACIAATIVSARRSRRVRHLAAPLVATATIAAVHHAQRFRPAPSNLARYGVGWVIDTTLVSAYLAGRCTGHARLVHRSLWSRDHCSGPDDGGT